MTGNQINYWNLQESKRHNVATEGETLRHNLTTEEETYRSNVAKEQYNISALNETSRHNLATEMETHRANLASEDIAQQNADTNARNANINYENAAINRLRQQSEAAVNSAKATAQGIINKYQNRLSQAQIDEIYKRMDKMDVEMAEAQRANTLKAWRNVTDFVVDVSQFLLKLKGVK